jgi:ABC-type transport system involved in multi-copper enzyme maturation permease subunit
VIVVPVIARELRASARQPFTYYLRLLGASAVLFACLLFLLEQYSFGSNVGGQLFGRLHFSLFWSVWVLVPVLAADCLSREKREGTLGLLFLTALKANDIVVAKVLAHGLRALTLGLAVLPIVTLPFLLGGVSWTEAVMSVVMNISAMCLALAAGVLASAWSRAWLRSLLYSAVLAIGFLLAWSFAAGLLLTATLTPASLSQAQFSIEYILFNGLGFIINAGVDWPNFLRLVSGSQWFIAMAELLLSSLLILCLAILLAGKRTAHSWREEPPSARMVWWQTLLFTPFLWLSFFHRWMRRKLERNPIGWLEQRTWSGRLVVWAWFAVLISVYSAVLTEQRNFFSSSHGIQSVMAWLLAGSMAMGAAGSFRRERQSGVLELLLVCPLGEHQIIAGRLRGIWTQFLPATAMLLGLWLYFASIIPEPGSVPDIFFYAITFLTLPVVGLYFSLRCRNFVSSFLGTLGGGLLVPMVTAASLHWLWWTVLYAGQYGAPGPGWGVGPSPLAALCELIMAALCWRRMHHSLRRRSFALERTDF